jgi:hypothetical protein
MGRPYLELPVLWGAKGAKSSVELVPKLAPFTCTSTDTPYYVSIHGPRTQVSCALARLDAAV